MAPSPSLTPCPLCRKDESHPRFQATDPLSSDSFQLVTCANCGLTYVNPRPSGDQPDAYYASF